MKARLLLLALMLPLFAKAEQVSSIYDDSSVISKELIAEYIEWASPYIRQYPPRFTSKNHRARILSSTEDILKEVSALDPKAITDDDLLTDLAYILSMGHNLNMGTGELSKEFFEEAIKRNQENRRANYLLGMFLVSTRKYHFESIQYLEKALELGEEDARFTLGLIAVNQGRTEEGLSMLKAYSNIHPTNEHVKEMISAIENESLEFRKSE